MINCLMARLGFHVGAVLEQLEYYHDLVGDPTLLNLSAEIALLQMEELIKEGFLKNHFVDLGIDTPEESYDLRLYGANILRRSVIVTVYRSQMIGTFRGLCNTFYGEDNETALFFFEELCAELLAIKSFTNLC